MNTTISIRPSKDLRNNYSKISELSKHNPVAITVNGKEDTIIMSHENYFNLTNYVEELEEKISLYEHIQKAEEDVKAGRVYDAKEVFDQLRKEINEHKI